MDLIALSIIAIEAAKAAGNLIKERMNTEIMVNDKVGGNTYASQVVTEVDIACEKIILEILLSSCKEYNLALLSEETEDDGSRFEKEYFWCIDPMDGTLPFIHKQPGFSVSIALVAKDGIPWIGVVYDPSTDTLYHAIKGHGVYKNGDSWKVENSNNHLTYVTDKKLKDTPKADKIESLLSEYVDRLELTGLEELAGAGAVLNAIRVLENGPACMIKLPKKEDGGGSVWDFAATVCIYQELGLAVTNLGGGALDLNRKENTFMNHEGVLYINW